MSKPKIPQTLLIDGDILLYRFACTNEFGIVWEEGQDAVKVVNLEAAQFDTAMFIERMSEKLHNEDVVVVFSGQNNFRYKVLPSYKHNRVGLEKPALYSQLKDYLIANFTTKEKEGLEGDDVMGILATRWPGHFILATIDKDLQQIPGELYNWNLDVFKEIAPEEADRFFYLQVLTGDSCDGYTGCPGIGPIRAEKILAEAEEEGISYWEAIHVVYVSHGLTEADAIQQARVARILRASDYDFKTKEIKLWTPSV
jgi:DNA polymerase-1